MRPLRNQLSRQKGCGGHSSGVGVYPTLRNSFGASLVGSKEPGLWGLVGETPGGFEQRRDTVSLVKLDHSGCCVENKLQQEAGRKGSRGTRKSLVGQGQR